MQWTNIPTEALRAVLNGDRHSFSILGVNVESVIELHNLQDPTFRNIMNAFLEDIISDGYLCPALPREDSKLNVNLKVLSFLASLSVKRIELTFSLLKNIGTAAN